MLVTAALPRSRIHQSSPYRVTEKAVTKARDTGKAFLFEKWGAIARFHSQIYGSSIFMNHTLTKMEIGEWKPVKKWVLENGNEGKGQVQYTGQDVGLIRSKGGNDRTSSSSHDGLDLRQKDRAIGHPNILLTPFH